MYSSYFLISKTYTLQYTFRYAAVSSKTEQYSKQINTNTA
jgi:hypothetical protein